MKTLSATAVAVLFVLSTFGEGGLLPSAETRERVLQVAHWSNGEETLDVSLQESVVVVFPSASVEKSKIIWKTFQTADTNHLEIYCNGLASGSHFVIFTDFDGMKIRHTGPEDTFTEYVTANTARLGLIFQEEPPKVRCVAKAISASAPPPDDNAGSCRCGIRNRANRIIGGRLAGPHEFPWQVGVLRNFHTHYSSRPHCGGTIISSRYVLTAGHCVDDHIDGDRRDYAVLYGTNDADTYRKGAQLMDVELNLIHSGYVKQPLTNDIALLRLVAPLQFNHDVSPACLPDGATDFTGMVGVASGWGSTTDYVGRGASELKTYDTTINPEDKCYWSDQQICLKGSPYQSVCAGDSGGPLVVDVSGNYEVVGAASFVGDKTCVTHPPAFTRVTTFLPWIRRHGVGDELDDVICGR